MRRYVLPALAILGFFLVINAVSAAAAVLPGAGDDPFAAFDSLKVGGPLSRAYRHDCQGSPSTDANARTYCMIMPETGPIMSAIVTGRNEQIYSLWFHLRDVPIAQLIQHWGRPSSIQRGKGIYVVWWGKGMYAVARGALADGGVAGELYLGVQLGRGYSVMLCGS
jgi:hypothetical protein